MSLSGCYFPDGTVLPLDYHPYHPCAIDPVRTICCNFAIKEDKCNPNGVCQSIYLNATPNGTAIPEPTYYLGYCTNPDPHSGDCLDVCRGPRGENTTDNRVTPCDGPDGTRWCCGGSNACCSDKNNDGVVEIPKLFNRERKSTAVESEVPAQKTSSKPPGQPISSSISSITTKPRETPTQSSSLSSPTQSLTPSSRPSSNGNTSPSTGARVGIAIGTVLAVLGLLSLAFFIYKALAWRKDIQARKKGEWNPPPNISELESGNPATSEMVTCPSPRELAVTPAAAEMMACPSPAELPAKS